MGGRLNFAGDRNIRPRLARDLAIIIAVKILALIAIKLIWFSDPPATADIDRVLLGPAGEQQPPGERR